MDAGESFSVIEDFNESIRNPDLILSPEVQSNFNASRVQYEEVSSPTSQIVREAKRSLSSKDLGMIEELKSR